MPLINIANLQQFQAVNLQFDPGHIAGPVIIPNAARVRINWALADGKIAHNILYASWTGTPALTTALAESIRAALVAGTGWSNFAAFIHTTCSLTSVTLLDVRTATGTEINSTGAATPGLGTGNALPDEVSLAITLRTNNRGPSGRGRFYVPGFAGLANTAGNVIATGAVSAATVWGDTNVRGGITSNLGAMALGLPARAAYTSLSTGRVFPARAATTVLVTSALCRDNHWDSQRRRGLR